ncbi:hypothetical protein [Parageobacillus thermoglucosidasius]|uniref:Uncharacterized protein n=1 Tax=Parageobacillus thermoglucosidasius TaxID=1426 RepID=A0AAN1D5H8_PARTM|nr:hypothetical protein [Parageobacillus thermoglucosidasius]ALF08778.1 hypothetical protein AOT13_01250 [Parageobacillus thermoglucosidasius]ANZ28861.1 hypothetical protein BCV53_01260 [Parageobacillus thermoglucosidasius]APM79598.1 hypothetical protein BCV54_01265 [Parageobacillus thermoglucosidasius]KJX68437.1 hypothetical protein WH82_12335 [Parageobacillus thermoglucosidasius]MBY6268582.1 hypothetical protein [Parageobacillus thermoglucosidasius]
MVLDKGQNGHFLMNFPYCVTHFYHFSAIIDGFKQQKKFVKFTCILVAKMSAKIKQQPTESLYIFRRKSDIYYGRLVKKAALFFGCLLY